MKTILAWFGALAVLALSTNASAQTYGPDPATGNLAEVWAGAPSVVKAGDLPVTIKAVYTPRGGELNLASLDDQDLAVLTPGGLSWPVWLRKIEPQPTPVDAAGMVQPGVPWRTLAIYELAAPSEGWSAGLNGEYPIHLLPEAVALKDGAFLPAGRIGTLRVAIENRPPPVARWKVELRPIIEESGVQVLAKIHLPDPSWTVADWGEVVREENHFRVQPVVAQDPGQVVPAVIQVVEHTYDLGGLEAGRYQFTMVFANQQTAQVGFQVGGPVPPPPPPPPPPPAVVAAFAKPVTAAGSDPVVITAWYGGGLAVDQASLGDGDLLVKGPNEYAQLVTLREIAPADPNIAADPAATGLNLSADAAGRWPGLTVVYELAAPEGGWTTAANGAYTLWIAPEAVALSDGSFLPSELAGRFEVAIRPPRLEAKASLEATVTGTTATLAVQVEILRPEGYLITDWGQAVLAANGEIRIEAVAQPGASLVADWEHSYTLENLPYGRHFAVFFLNGQPLAKHAFEVARPAIQVAAEAEDITEAKETAHEFVVRFTAAEDGTNVDEASLGDDDVMVVGFNDRHRHFARFLGVDPLASPLPIIQARYAVDPPEAGWTARANGMYGLILAEKGVADVNGAALASRRLTEFAVKIVGEPPPPPEDEHAPLVVAEARNLFATPRDEAGEPLPYAFRVLYLDQAGLDLASLETAVLHANRFARPLPAGDLAKAALPAAELAGLPATLVKLTSLDEAHTVVQGEYTLAAPDGTWDANDNGHYALYAPADAIRNSLGNAHRGGPIGGFGVLIWKPAESATDLGNGWNEVPKLGYLNLDTFPWLWNKDHGWWCAAQSRVSADPAAPTGSDWFYDQQVAWLWTSSDLYPWLYSAEGGQWLFYLEGTQNPRWFYEVKSARWSSR